jgi:peroxiredoxin
MGIGLPIGTPAPEFELPGITGEKRSLASLRQEGKDVLLVFSSPFCNSCVALTSKLLRWAREREGLPNMVLISSGTAQDNLAKMRGFEASRVLLQRDFEVAEAYDSSSTPSAVLVGADGLIRSGLALGGEAVEQLLSSTARRAKEEDPNRQTPAVP